MARRENRGGYRAPNDRTQKVSGVGPNSKRTDNQPVRAPDFGTSEDLTFGDKQQIEARLRQQPLPQGRAPQISGPAPAGGPPTPGGGGVPPEFLFGMPTNRPGEPSSEGLPMGPGAGPEALATQPDPDDDKEFVLHVLSGPPFNNQAAAQMLSEMQASRVVAPPVPQMAPEGVPLEEEVAPEEEPGIVDFPVEEEGPVEEELVAEEEGVEQAPELAPEEAPQGEEAVAEASVEGAEVV